MTDGRSLDERLDAVERALSDGHRVDGLPDAARMESRIDDLETTVDDVDDRLAELEAAVQALRGFAGGVRAVDESVERRANAAIARVERLESALRDSGADSHPHGPHDDAAQSPDTPRTVDDGDAGARHDGPSDAADSHHDPDGAPAVSADGPTDATLAATAAANADDRMAAVDEAGGSDGGTDASLGERLRRLL